MGEIYRKKDERREGEPREDERREDEGREDEGRNVGADYRVSFIVSFPDP
jgi:hypothetical protein